MKNLKDLQLEIVNKYNPARNEFQTWIRDKSDVLTFKEAIDSEECLDDTGYTDYTENDVKKALETGKITIYSSHPIKQGVFVTPSFMEAQSYAGYNEMVYSKTVELDKVAWIDISQGQYADIEMEKAKAEYPDLIEQIRELDNGYSVLFTNITDSIATAEIFNGYDEVIESEVEMNLWSNMTSEEILTKFNDKFFNGDFTDFYPGEMDIEVELTSIDETNQTLEFCVDISGGAFDGLSFYSEVSSDGIHFDIDADMLSKLDTSGIKEEITALINENIEYDDEIPTDFFEKPSLDDILSAAENKAVSQITDFRQTKEIDALAI